MNEHNKNKPYPKMGKLLNILRNICPAFITPSITPVVVLMNVCIPLSSITITPSPVLAIASPPFSIICCGLISGNLKFVINFSYYQNFKNVFNDEIRISLCVSFHFYLMLLGISTVGNDGMLSMKNGAASDTDTTKINTKTVADNNGTLVLIVFAILIIT